MPKKGHTEEGILRTLRDAEAGETSVAICRDDVGRADFLARLAVLDGMPFRSSSGTLWGC